MADMDLKTAILDARYIDLIDLASALTAEDTRGAESELAGPRAQAMAAAIFRWAAAELEKEGQA